jgi:hypothetical protein
MACGGDGSWRLCLASFVVLYYVLEVRCGRRFWMQREERWERNLAY